MMEAGEDTAMKLLFNMILIAAGLAGIAVAFLSDIVVTSSVQIINGTDLSLILGLFSALVLIQSFFSLVNNAD